MPNLRVLIAGGGLAGPLLAHGLLRQGLDPLVFERDGDPDSRGQGYRISIAPEGARALRDCLPPALYDLAFATSGRRGTAVTVLGTGLQELHRMTFPAPLGDDDGSAGISVDRQTLRLILLAGLEGRTRFGAAFSRYQLGERGTVRAWFDDGTSAQGDVLVGAEGSVSGVRAQLAPEARVRETGQLLIFGKSRLTEEVLALAPPQAFEGFSTVVGADGRFLPLAGLEFRDDPAQAAARWPGLVLTETENYLMWVLGAPAGRYGEAAADLRHRDPAALRDLAAAMIEDWHPSLPRLIRLGDPSTVSAATIRSSCRPPLWPNGPVTLIGDAAHCMPPAGVGAAVALRDAALLASRLGEAARGERVLTAAIRAYEEEMLDYGFAAVARAEQVSGQLG
ncbi:MAG: FAD-dependent oxidoreductase [Candidatus Dormibacteraceae bacterium]